MGLARRDDVESRIEAMQEALSHLNAGTYGLCKNCGRQINPERLEILPAMLLCTACASKQEFFAPFSIRILRQFPQSSEYKSVEIAHLSYLQFTQLASERLLKVV